MGKQSGTQKTTSETKLPAWYETAVKGNINFANEAAKNLAQPYQGNTVAGLNNQQQTAINATGANVGATNAGYNQATGVAGQVAGYKPKNFLQGDVGAYMSPYIKNVEDAAATRFGQLFKQNLNAIGDQALGAKAFGGSRQGVQEGVAAAESARQMGDFSANLRNQAFGQAQGMMESDMNRAMTGQQVNLQGAQALGQLTNDQQQAYLQSLQSSLTAGGMNQAQVQAQLDAEKAKYDAMRNVPLEQLDIRMSPLNGIQVGGKTTESTPTTGNPLLSGIGAMGSLFTGLGALGLSDENEKTNIRKLGKDGLTGMDLYAYDYRSDVKAARRQGTPMPPKRVGPMAQDIERHQPGRVRKVGGKRVVSNLGFGG